jgi:hypothetical protein
VRFVCFIARAQEKNVIQIQSHIHQRRGIDQPAGIGPDD